MGDYLLKPIKREELSATLEKMRERYRHRTDQVSKEEQLRLQLQSDIAVSYTHLIKLISKFCG